MTSPVILRYDPVIFERFPNTIGGAVAAYGINNALTSAGLQTEFAQEQKAVLRRIGDSALSDIPSLAAWRTTFRKFGAEPTRYRPAPEALLRRLVKDGDIPSLNTLVDMGNLVSIRYALPIAIFDLDRVNGTVTVHPATGEERYVERGQNELKHPDQGEVVFTDETGMVVARRWCWRQGDESAATVETRAAIIVIEAQHEEGRSDVERALDDMRALLRQYVGGEHKYAILDVHRPFISV